jgi:hypothetical protein
MISPLFLICRVERAGVIRCVLEVASTITSFPIPKLELGIEVGEDDNKVEVEEWHTMAYI